MSVSEIVETDLDVCLDSYESRLALHGRVDFSEFLPSPEHPQYYSILTELLRVTLEHEWKLGHATPLQEHLRRFPGLRELPAALQAICFEEYRQRRQYGELVEPQEYARHYQVDVWAWPSISQAPGSGTTPPEEAAFPNVGQQFLGFQLIEVLGRGTFAQVYLARQDELSQRPVALKVSRHRSNEAKRLARLQHTHIMPIYSVHQHAAWDVVCMPYLGARTVADLTASLRQRQHFFETQSISQETWKAQDLQTMPYLGNGTLLPYMPARSNVLPEAGQLPEYTSAADILRLFKQLASGLQHAHEREIVHRDLKPANILLAEDGTPLILDFNLSHEGQAGREAREAFVGGTLPYMAPEHLEGFLTGNSTGDARADLFSLGVILYELLYGRAPYPQHQGVLDTVLKEYWQDRQQLPPRSTSPFADHTPAVQAIVEHCLQPEPQQRYQSAQQLHDDLDRHLQNLPLCHAPEPSRKERLQKWTRRHPRLVSLSSLGALAFIVFILFGSAWLYRSQQLAELQAIEDARDVQRDLRLMQHEFTGASMQEAAQLEQTLAQANFFLERYSLRSAAKLEASALYQNSSAVNRLQLRDTAAEAHFLIAAGLQAKAEQKTEAEARTIHEQALFANNTASSFYHDKAPASFQRQALQLNAALGRAVPATSRDERPLQTARDLCQQAIVLGIERRFGEAMPLWSKAVKAEPQNFWTWYGLGYCAEQLERYDRALECYSACIALDPEFAAAYFDRGRMRMRQQDYAAAIEDLQQAEKLKPGAEVSLNLGIALLETHKFPAALAALKQAKTRGCDPVRVQLLFAKAYEGEENPVAAAVARRLAQSETPRDSDTWTARGVSVADQDAQAALTCFTSALQANPHSWPALESAAHVLAEKLDRLSDAIAMLDRAVKMFPEKTACVANRGVLHARAGNTALALQDARTALAMESTPAIHYQVACIFSLLAKDNTQHKEQALEYLSSALLQGYGAQLVGEDQDLNLLRTDPQFLKLQSAVQTLKRNSTVD